MCRTLPALAASRRFFRIGWRLEFNGGIDALIDRRRLRPRVARLLRGRQLLRWVFAASEVAERHFDRRPRRIGIRDFDVQRLLLAGLLADIRDGWIAWVGVAYEALIFDGALGNL